MEPMPEVPGGELSDAEPAARYTPWTKGVYEVAPGLRPFGTDFGNGAADRRVFQLDADFDKYAENKRTALRERRSKYVRSFRLAADVERAAIDLIVARLAADYPDRFQAGWEGDHRTLSEDAKTWVLPAFGRGNESQSLDMLARLVQEDFAVVSTEHSADWVSYINLCSPSHWAAEEKVGRSFFDVHAPIPAFERVNAVAAEMVQTMVQRGPFVRFVWGVESDDRLNHHTEPPPGWDPEEWHGRLFDRGQFWVRTERQVIFGMPAVGAALFVIRVGYVPNSAILSDPALRDSLRAALLSMSPDARHYKGLERHWDALMALM
jgi:hypothetical protein